MKNLKLLDKLQTKRTLYKKRLVSRINPSLLLMSFTFFYKTSYPNEEVNRTDPSPWLMRVNETV
jgi:hypothetical protein